MPLYEEMKMVNRGYSLRGLEDGKVNVPEKGKKSCNGFHYMGPFVPSFHSLSLSLFFFTLFPFHL